MRIATWNVNSIRSRIDQLEHWLSDRQVDIALLQETKCGDDNFPFNRISDVGYECAHHGVDHWNGVAILSRVGLDDVVRGFRSDHGPACNEPRMITARCGGVQCRSVYVPNGRSVDDPHFDFKLRWLGHLADELNGDRSVDALALVAGDFNVGMNDLDFYDPKRWKNKKHATVEERSAVQATLDLGFIDLARSHYPSDSMFTWWNYFGTQFAKNKGLRIDLALGSPLLAGQVTDVWVDRHARDPLVVEPAKPSDHAPVIIDLETNSVF